MRKGYLVTLPPGAGKTRTVLKHLLDRLKSKSNDNWRTLCNNLLVLGPNKRVEHVWLRELALATFPSQDEINIRKETTLELRLRLATDGMKLEFKSFSDLKSIKRLPAYAFIVIDEWHRFRSDTPHLLALVKRGPFGNHTYLVSATPLNPVMEQERDMLVEHPKEDDPTIRECKEKALILISCLLMGKGSKVDEQTLILPFGKAIQTMGVHWIEEQTQWVMPLHKRITSFNSLKEGELEFISQAKDYGSEIIDWKSKEAAWAIGLVRTKFNNGLHLLANKSYKGKKKVFGYPYEQPHVAGKSRPLEAAQWLLKEHSRVPRLIDMLVACGIITRINNSNEYELTGKKVLLFCVHQGIARGLQLALQAAIPAQKNNISAAVHEFTDEHQISFMDKKKAPYILIATDKLSESIDLHGACTVLVHYELPWSPLRLLQRVGRLTRMRSDGSFHKVEVYHIIIPGSVEEERVNRLIRRTQLLHEELAWPKELYDETKKNGKENWKRIAKALIGAGPSLHLAEKLS